MIIQYLFADDALESGGLCRGLAPQGILSWCRFDILFFMKQVDYSAVNFMFSMILTENTLFCSCKQKNFHALLVMFILI